MNIDRWNYTLHHRLIEGQIPYNRVCQRQAMKWTSQEDLTWRGPFSHPDSLLQICSQGLQDDKPNSSLSIQSGTDCRQLISGFMGLPAGLPVSGPFALVSVAVYWNLNMWRNVMVSNEYTFYRWPLDRRIKVFRGCRECYGGCCTNRGLSSLEAMSMQRDIKMKFCNQW